ncbi:hypothetical protein EHF36_04695 [Kerstersia gyiorum]|nr:hypothetical protein EHF36_04695 [Kerstersia gyiorum]
MGGNHCRSQRRSGTRCDAGRARTPVRRRRPCPSSEIEWLTDNGSAYIAGKTRAFVQQIGLKPVTTPVRSPQSNGMAESFVKTIKRDYVAFMPKPDVPTALQNLAIAFEHYNEQPPITR